MARASSAKTPKSAKAKAPMSKAKGKPNTSILTFFKKVDGPTPDLFIGTGERQSFHEDDIEENEYELWDTPVPSKRRKTEGECSHNLQSSIDPSNPECTPPPPTNAAEQEDKGRNTRFLDNGDEQGNNLRKKPRGPFLSDSESDEEEEEEAAAEESQEPQMANVISTPASTESAVVDNEDVILPSSFDFEGFEGIEDFEEDDLDRDEEYQDQKYYERQKLLEQEQRDLEAAIEASAALNGNAGLEESCPMCNSNLAGLSHREISIHVNACLDGTGGPTKLGISVKTEVKAKEETLRLFRPPKPGQKNPFEQTSSSTLDTSAFSKLMANHAEDSAWKSAAAAENLSRGKPSFERTCPFYKILPGFSICVDAFRFGAVEGCEAYFLSHFHSDHYIGLTSKWSHGPIYCSKVTANLVVDQLRVDSKYVVALEFEKEAEVPGTGAKVTMIPANHCPGSSLFLFEKPVGKGKNPRVQRILHCGDFRACRQHIEHPLLRPDVMDMVTGRTKQQQIDICYLDTTYLNPKYAFPTQEAVIQACSQMCIYLNSNPANADNIMEYGSADRADKSMQQFIKSNKTSSNKDVISASTSSKPPSSKLLVVVGTYSIGKERICLGIARALSSKIYAPAPKRRICASLEDPELSALLTDDPRAAQVHMTPLFEIRAETLDDYMSQFGSAFSRVVGFRPTGWNYRPPAGARSLEAPSVGTVLHGVNWKSAFGARDMVPQRGSTRRAACFGVPYSEHSSFRELTMFCCALRIARVIPTVNVGSAKSRERMRTWVERWQQEKRKNGLFKAEKF